MSEPRRESVKEREFATFGPLSPLVGSQEQTPPQHGFSSNLEGEWMFDAAASGPK